MSILRMTIRSLFALATLALTANGAMAQQFDSGIPTGWTCTGNCGTSNSADGVVGLPPSSSSYGWVSTFGGIDGVSPFPNASVPSGGSGGLGNTNGSVLMSTGFAASSGEALNFQFNYVTSDGGTYADYAWVRLLNAGDLSQADVIFTARTNATTPDTIPGFGLPTLGSTTLTLSGVTVSSVPIITDIGYSVSSTGSNSGLGIGPLWSPLGTAYNGTCWDTGCGYTGWVGASYTVAAAGSYVLEFGVTNWDDTAWDSGMAFNAITIAGVPIDDDTREIPAIPEPEIYAMLGAGLALMGWVGRRRKPQAA